jgi:hypothetical protein
MQVCMRTHAMLTPHTYPHARLHENARTSTRARAPADPAEQIILTRRVSKDTFLLQSTHEIRMKLHAESARVHAAWHMHVHAACARVYVADDLLGVACPKTRCLWN